MQQKVEDLRLKLHQLGAAPQLASIAVERMIAKEESHRDKSLVP